MSHVDVVRLSLLIHEHMLLLAEQSLLWAEFDFDVGK